MADSGDAFQPEALREPIQKKAEESSTAAAALVAPSPPNGMRAWYTTSKVLPGGVIGSKVGELDETTSKFSQVILVENAEAFTLKPVILTDGSLAGRRVLMLVKNVTFLDLPGELRNKVWDYVLETDVTFAIGIPQPESTSTPATPSQLSQTTLALAQTNKTISTEVLGMVYGSNDFRFGNLCDLSDFVHRIGPMRAHLRRVDIIGSGCQPKMLKAGPWGLMLSMTKLRKLTMSHQCVTCYHQRSETTETSIARFLDELKPLLRAWHSANKDRPDSPSLLQLVNIVKYDSCRSCGARIKDGAEVCDTSDCPGDNIFRSGDKHMQKVSGCLRKMITEEFNVVAE